MKRKITVFLLCAALMAAVGLFNGCADRKSDAGETKSEQAETPGRGDHAEGNTETATTEGQSVETTEADNGNTNADKNTNIDTNKNLRVKCKVFREFDSNSEVGREQTSFYDLSGRELYRTSEEDGYLYSRETVFESDGYSAVVYWVSSRSAEINEGYIQFDEQGNLVEDSNGYTYAYEYDANGNVRSKTRYDSDGKIFDYSEYDEEGNVLVWQYSYFHENGKRTSWYKDIYHYDRHGNQQEVLCYRCDQSGDELLSHIKTEYEYNEQGEVILELHYESNAEGVMQLLARRKCVYTYGVNGEINTKKCYYVTEEGIQTEEHNLVVAYAYDRYGNLLEADVYYGTVDAVDTWVNQAIYEYYDDTDTKNVDYSEHKAAFDKKLPVFIEEGKDYDRELIDEQTSWFTPYTNIILVAQKITGFESVGVQVGAINSQKTKWLVPLSSDNIFVKTGIVRMEKDKLVVGQILHVGEGIFAANFSTNSITSIAFWNTANNSGFVIEDVAGMNYYRKTGVQSFQIWYGGNARLEFEEGVTPLLLKGDKVALLDQWGEVTELNVKLREDTELGYLSDGLFWCNNGFYNTQGKRVIDLDDYQYVDRIIQDSVPKFSNGIAKVYLLGADGGEYYIEVDQEGNILCEPTKSES